MKPPTRRRIFDVVGEAATNPDGVRRQDILCGVEPGDTARLSREPSNTFDPNAVAVWVGDGQVGYLCREDAAALAPFLDAGADHRAVIHCIRGGVPGATHYGCRVSIAWDGDKLHPHQPLDEQQLRSRAGKRRMAGRERDDLVRLVGKKSGCVVILGLVGFTGLLLTLH